MIRPHMKPLVLGAALILCIASSGCALLVAGAAGGGAAGAAASAKDEQQHAPMTYAGTVLANVFYVPAKIVFAGAGAAASGVAYVVTLGDSSTSNEIWNASVGGNYVLTPRMIEGEEPVRFVATADSNALERRT